jgi:hypothetical protein
VLQVGILIYDKVSLINVLTVAMSSQEDVRVFLSSISESVA